MNNEDIPESAKMEEGMIASTGVPTGSTTNSTASTTDKRLSTVSKMYDTSGKGELDDVQLAMRNMDQTGRGYLTNDKVYGLMQEQLKMQKSMFQMKKIIIGLMVFVVILALSNLGTSFASAILAKDATTNDKDELVSKATGEVVATGKSVETFQGVPPNDVSGRKLCVTTTGGGKPETTCEAYSSDFTMMHESDALTMLTECKKDRLVKLTHTFGEGDKAQTYERTVCNPEWGCTNIYYGPNNAPTTGDLCVGSTGPETIYVRPHAFIRGMDPNSSFYSISTSDSAVATSDAFTSNEWELCNTDGDCDSGLSCEPNIALYDPIPFDLAKCPNLTDEECQAWGTGLSCFNGQCGYCDELNENDTTCVAGSRPVCTSEQGASVPVCGCNEDSDCNAGETCAASSCAQGSSKFCAAAGDHDAECTSSCRKPAEGMACIVGVDADPLTVCATGLFCQFPEGTTCLDKTVERTGVCKDPNHWSLSCPTSPDASCVEGCDGEVYNHHDCAQANSVSVLSKTSCPVQGGTLAGCGGSICADNEFCKEDGCGDGSAGTCTLKPEICTTIVDEVCGCDGNTHSNSCFADQAGVNIVSFGACPKDGRN
jgi:hypothetical protein